MKKFRLLTVALAAALACAFPIGAWAADATEDLLASELEDTSEVFSIAGWNSEQDGKKELSRSVEIKLDEGAQSRADAGELSYGMSVWGTCDECRSMKLSGSVKFLDESGNALATWSDSYSEYDTWRQTHTLSGSGIVPAGTVRIEAQVKNSVNLSSDLELTGTLTILTADYQGRNNETYHSTYNFPTFDTPSSHWSFSNQLVDRGVGELNTSITVFFGEDAKKDIDEGIALSGFCADVDDVSTSLNGHVLDCDVLVRFFDATGNEIPGSRIEVNESDYGGWLGSYISSAKVYLTSGYDPDIPIPEGTAYVKMETSATVGTLADIRSYTDISFGLTGNLSSADSAQVTSTAPSADESEATDEAATEGEGEATEDQTADDTVTAPTEEELADPAVEEAWAEVEKAEEQAAADEAVVAETDLFTPAMRLASAATFLQENFAEELDAVDPDSVVSEETVVTVLYASKLIAEGETMDTLGAMDTEQLRADAAAWAEDAGLGDLYESGVDTYRETINVIKGYMGVF